MNITEGSYFETNPEKKDDAWFNKLVSYFRIYWRPIVDAQIYKDNMDIILSRTGMEEVKKMFKDPTKVGMTFLGIIVIEKIRNILIGERTKAGINVTVNAIDPTAQTEKERDRKLLQQRQEFEKLMSFMNKGMGLPSYSMADEKDKEGIGPAAGNLDLFDQLQLDGNNPSDQQYFFEVWHRLLHEMDGQTLINNVFAANEINRFIEYWCNDIMAVKAVAGQSFVNEITGAIELSHLEPPQVMAIPGRRDDAKDSICLGWERNVTVGDMIRKIGSEFRFDTDMMDLMRAVNFVQRSDYTAVTMSDGNIWRMNDHQEDRLCSIDQFMQFKVGFGYIEAKSEDVESYKEGKDWHGNFRSTQVSADAMIDKHSKYVKQSYYVQNTYKAYFMPTSSSTQRIFKFGRVWHQAVEGAEDEYSSYTIFFKKLPGPTVADIAKPYIEAAKELFTKFRWMVRKAKPKGRSYNYDSLMQIAKKLFNTGQPIQDLNSVIALFENGINELTTYPVINGQPIGGGTHPHVDLPNGLDPTALNFRELIRWCVEQISDSIGTAPREAIPAQPNEGYRLKEQNVEESRNATQYMNTMLDTIAQQKAKYVLAVSQDIIQFKTTKPYKWLNNLVGDIVLKRLARLKYSFHRYGIFLNSFSTYQERQEVKQATMAAAQNKEIPYEVALLINTIDDYRMAGYILSYEKKRAEREAQKQLQVASQLRQQEEATRVQGQIALEKEKGQWGVKKEATAGYWQYKVKELDVAGRKEVKQLGIDSDGDKQQHKADSEIQKINAKANTEAQTPL